MYLLAKILVISTTVVLSYGNSRVHVVDDFPIHFGDQCKDKFSRTIYNNLEGNHVNDDPLIYGLTEASFIGEVGMAVFKNFWCGPGATADNWNELGKNDMLARCCREHDFCPASIAEDETRFGQKNDGGFTLSHCLCERRFQSCLWANYYNDQDKTSSKWIEFIYFVLRKYNPLDFNNLQCIDKDIKVPDESTCTYRGMSKHFKGKCLFYKGDEDSNRVFETKLFKLNSDVEYDKFSQYILHGLSRYNLDVTAENKTYEKDQNSIKRELKKIKIVGLKYHNHNTIINAEETVDRSRKRRAIEDEL